MRYEKGLRPKNCRAELAYGVVAQERRQKLRKTPDEYCRRGDTLAGSGRLSEGVFPFR